MEDTITSILTDASVRDETAVQDTLVKKAEIASPWFNVQK